MLFKQFIFPYRAFEGAGETKNNFSLYWNKNYDIYYFEGMGFCLAQN